MTKTQQVIEQTQNFGAANYHHCQSLFQRLRVLGLKIQKATNI